jgi:hypothetical protein
MMSNGQVELGRLDKAATTRQMGPFARRILLDRSAALRLFPIRRSMSSCGRRLWRARIAEIAFAQCILDQPNQLRGLMRRQPESFAEAFFVYEGHNEFLANDLDACGSHRREPPYQVGPIGFAPWSKIVLYLPALACRCSLNCSYEPPSKCWRQEENLPLPPVKAHEQTKPPIQVSADTEPVDGCSPFHQLGDRQTFQRHLSTLRRKHRGCRVRCRLHRSAQTSTNLTAYSPSA